MEPRNAGSKANGVNKVKKIITKLSLMFQCSRLKRRVALIQWRFNQRRRRIAV